MVETIDGVVSLTEFQLPIRKMSLACGHGRFDGVDAEQVHGELKKSAPDYFSDDIQSVGVRVGAKNVASGQFYQFFRDVNIVAELDARFNVVESCEKESLTFSGVTFTAKLLPYERVEENGKRVTQFFYEKGSVEPLDGDWSQSPHNGLGVVGRCLVDGKSVVDHLAPHSNNGGKNFIEYSYSRGSAYVLHLDGPTQANLKAAAVDLRVFTDEVKEKRESIYAAGLLVQKGMELWSPKGSLPVVSETLLGAQKILYAKADEILRDIGTPGAVLLKYL